MKEVVASFLDLPKQIKERFRAHHSLCRQGWWVHSPSWYVFLHEIRQTTRMPSPIFWLPAQSPWVLGDLYRYIDERKGKLKKPFIIEITTTYRIAIQFSTSKGKDCTFISEEDQSLLAVLAAWHKALEVLPLEKE